MELINCLNLQLYFFQGKDPAKMWSDVQQAIAEIFIMKEHHIVDAVG